MVQVAKEHLLFDEISVNVGLEDLPEKEQAVARANYLHTGSLQVNSLDQADGEDGLATVLADEQRAQLEGAETNQHLTSPLLLSTVQAVPSPTVAPLHHLLPMVRWGNSRDRQSLLSLTLCCRDRLLWSLARCRMGVNSRDTCCWPRARMCLLSRWWLGGPTWAPPS